MPPRRTKRNSKKPAPITSTEVTKDDARSRQNRPLQPPLPKKCQRNKSRSTVEDLCSRCDIAASCSKVESVKNRDVDIATDTISATREIPSRIGKANDDTIPAKSVALKPLLSSFKLASSKRNTLNKYPPLFFTLHDFEDVMSGDRDKKIFAPPSASLEKKSSTAQILNDENDICFRVTTTNLPFEKCLDSWRGSFDNEFTEKFDNYQFDNENESDRTNVERLSNCNDSSRNDDFEHRTGTKVRFVIDSQNHSKHNGSDNVKIHVPCDSLQSGESIFDNEKASEQSVAASFIKLTEIREEFTDVKDSGDNLRDKSCASSAEKRNPATREGPFMLTDANKLDMKLKTIPQSYYDDINGKIHKEDSNFISRNEPVSNENLGNENITTTITKKEIIMSDKQIDRSETLDAFSEIAKSVRHLTDKSLEVVCSNEEANAAKITKKNKHREEEILLKKTDNNIKEKCIIKNEEIFVNESLPTFLNNCDNDKLNILTDEFRIEETRRSPTKEYKEKNNFVDSKYNREEASPSKKNFTKNVKIKRNSFLEAMLSDDSTDTSTNCAITTKTNLVSPINMDEKISTLNESTNKVREPDIAKKSEYVCNSYNKTTKVNMENQKNSKMQEKIVKVSNTDVKSMQSENKNACDVKNDVLNELLCNFNNIKLKIVSPENKKPAMKIDGEDDKNISRSIAIDNGIFKKKEGSTSLEISESGVCDISISAKIIDVNNDTTIVEKTGKEDLTKINVKERFQDLRNSACNPAIDKKIIEKKDIEVIKFNEACNIKNKTVKDDSVKKMIDENNSNIRSEEICVKREKIEETSEGIKSADEVKRESKKLRDIRAPKTILKNKSVECEQQRMNKFQNRIPIGAPATMNKIFDSREFEAIAVASRSLEKNERKHLTSKQTRSHSKEKTDDGEIIMASEADDDDDRRRVANRSTLALLDDTKGSDDKCAIARKTTSIIPCNNNDNNRAVTPVVNISNDQSSRDVVTITPGKVRSFVKYYEIRGDATTVERHSKINDREKVTKRKSTKSQAPSVVAGNSQPEIITEREETKNGGRNIKSNSTLETSSNEIQFSKIAAKIPKDSADDSIHKTARAESKVTKGHDKNDSNVIDRKTCAPLAKTGAKKSVQFLGGFTVIHSETFDGNESAGIVTDYDANALRKRRAPGIPPSRDSDGCQKLVRELKKSEKLPDVEKSSFQRREAVAQVHVISYGENSVTNRNN